MKIPKRHRHGSAVPPEGEMVIKCGGPREGRLVPIRHVGPPVKVARPASCDRVIISGTVVLNLATEAHDQIIAPRYWCELLEAN